MNKETVLRVFNSGKDPVSGMNRKQNECSFHLSIGEDESLIQEEIQFGQVIGIRVRKLSNPPPDVTFNDTYKAVTKLELSCAVSINWVFSVASTLPGLNVVRFGASCFETPYGDGPPGAYPSHVKSCPSVKELIVSFDHRKLEQKDFDKDKVRDSMDEILDYSTKYFPNLTKADLYMPVGVKMDTFLRNNQFLASTGEQRPYPLIGMVKFQSTIYSKKCNEVPPPPPPPPSRKATNGDKETPQIAYVGPMLDPRRRPTTLKRGHSSSGVSSEGTEEDLDIPLPKTFSKRSNNHYSDCPLTPTPPPPGDSPPIGLSDSEDPFSLNVNSDSAYYHGHERTPFAPIPMIVTNPNYTTAYYPTRRGSSNGHDNHSDNLSSCSSNSPPSSEVYTDFSQMYSRRY